MFRISFLLVFFGLFSPYGFSQKHVPFQGKLTYKVEFVNGFDSTTRFHSYSSMYTNDTLVRIESFSEQIGSQVLIKHLVMQKYYILLEMNGEKFAIQQHVAKDTVPSKFQFSKKWGRKKVDGLKMKKLEVKSASFPTPMTMWYAPSLSPKYLDVLKGIPGLPTDYYVQTEDGYFHYILEKVEREAVNKDVFGIPSDFKKVSFEEFMQQMMPSEN